MGYVKKRVLAFLMIATFVLLFLASCGATESEFSLFKVENTDKISVRLYVIGEDGKSIQENKNNRFKLSNGDALVVEINELSQEYKSAIFFDDEKVGHNTNASKRMEKFLVTDNYRFLRKGQHSVQIVEYEPTPPDDQVIHKDNFRESQKNSYSIED